VNRRHFLGVAALGASVEAIPRSSIAAIAFDGFVIFDPRPVGALADELFPGRGAELTNAWRTRQAPYDASSRLRL
jgi:2-haloacid dehalogenase